MTTKPRYVFDTSTIIGASLFTHSTPGLALRQALAQGTIVLSTATLVELASVLERQKFDRYLTTAEREEFLAAFTDRALLIETTVEIAACRDPDDDKFLELAVSYQAACVISSDEDLLVLTPFQEIPVLTPAQFLDFARSQQPSLLPRLNGCDSFHEIELYGCWDHRSAILRTPHRGPFACSGPNG